LGFFELYGKKWSIRATRKREMQESRGDRGLQGREKAVNISPHQDAVGGKVTKKAVEKRILDSNVARKGYVGPSYRSLTVPSREKRNCLL